MGSVYLVEDNFEDNRRIALKTIKVEEQKLRALERFKKEFKSLTELHHPNLAEVYDFGIIRDSSSNEVEFFFTMEYVEGKNLFDASENLTYDELYELIVQICRALDYVHLRGFLHNDLKPENILIQTLAKGKYQAKLMDFGLAEENPTPGSIKGTASYIAPEIALSRTATLLSDLYSLGVVLYQVSTRRLPFQGNNAIEILRNHIDQEPLPPQKVKADIPGPLQTIILKLLSKNPQSRYQSASEIIETINHLTQKDFQIDAKNTEKSFLLSGKLIGREKEYYLFKKHLQGLLKGKKGGFILIRGDSGVGKSRLLNEFKYQAQLTNLNFFSGKAASEGSTPYQAIKDVLKQILPQFEESSKRKYIWILEKLIPESFEYESPVEMTKLSPEQEKLKLFDGITQLLKEFSESTPLVFGFDDLQLSDPSSLELLCYISRNIKGYPILILGTYQDKKNREQQEATFFETEVDELKTEGLLSEIYLKAFELPDLEKLLKFLLGIEALPPGFVQKVNELTGGNPLFIQEVMKAVFEEKSFSRKDLFWFLEKFDFSKLKIPRTLKGIICNRIRKLKPDLLSVSQIISIFNRAIDAELLQLSMPQNKDRLLSILKTLEKLEILKTEQEAGRDVFFFANAQIREVVYDEMESDYKKEMHYKLGLLLEDFYKSDRVAHAEELAYHFSSSDDEQKSLNFSLLAGRRSKKIFANNEAVKFFESTIQTLEKKKNFRVLSKVYDILIDLYQLLGKYEIAIKRFDEWIKLCNLPGRKAMAFEKIGMIYEKKGEYDLALEHLEKGIQQLAPEEKSSEIARLFYDSGYVHTRKGEFEKAKGFYEKALNILKSKKGNASQKETGKLLNATGMVHWFQSKYDKAIEYYNRSIEIFEKIKDEEEISSPYNNLGNISFALGDYDQAIKYYEKSLSMREKTGDINAIAGSFNNLGNAYYKKGNFAEALRNYKRSATIYSRIGARYSLIIPLSNIANINLDHADYGSALEYNQRCLLMSEKVGSTYSTTINTHNQGCIYQFLNQLDKALNCAHKNYSLQCKLKDNFGKAGTFSLMGDICRIKGEWFKSERYLQKSLRIYRELNSKSGEAECLKCLAELNLETGNYLKAFEFLRNSIKLSEESQDVGLFLSGLLLLGKTKLKAKNSKLEQVNFSWEEIEKDLNTALEKAEVQQKPELQWEILASLGACYQSRGKYTLATRYYRKSINILREIHARIPKEISGSYLSEPKKIQLRKEIYRLKEEVKTMNRNLEGAI